MEHRDKERLWSVIVLEMSANSVQKQHQALFTPGHPCTSRYTKTPTVVLAGSTLQPKPRPPPPPSFQSEYHSDSNEDGPSGWSELLRGGAPSNDPYLNFYSDLQGWDDKKADLLLNSDSSHSVFNYLTSHEEPQEDPIARLRKLKKIKPRQRKKTTFKKPVGETGAEEEEEEPPVPSQAFEPEEEEVEMPILEKTAAMTIEPKKESRVSTARPKQDLDYMTAPPTEKMALLRKRLISSATSAKAHWNGVQVQPDLGMAVLTGKRYQSCKETPPIRPKTAGPTTEKTLPPIASPEPLLPIVSKFKALEGEERIPQPYEVPKWMGKVNSAFKRSSKQEEPQKEDLSILVRKSTPVSVSDWISPDELSKMKKPKSRRSFRQQIAITRTIAMKDWTGAPAI
ncbi:hypothetical protein EDD86DRAFT_17881 [Gorgonomyces haynaldii]|nr:hypothetical protein EDD86DRAFT_17881 [Gorgonomyces haynaldii]